LKRLAAYYPHQYPKEHVRIVLQIHVHSSEGVAVNQFRVIIVVCCLCVGVVLGSAQTTGNDANFKRFEYGISGGVLLPVTLSMDMLSDNVVTSASPIFRGYAEVHIVEYFALGLYVNVAPITLDKLENHSVSVPSDYNSAFAYEFGGSIKVPIPVSQSIRVTPAFNMGYRRIHSKLASEVRWSIYSDVETTGDVNALGLNGAVQVTFLTGSLISPFVEAGFVSEPVGGNQFTTMTFAPAFYFTAGVCL
jgi:hypothetical protein